MLRLLVRTKSSQLVKELGRTAIAKTVWEFRGLGVWEYGHRAALRHLTCRPQVRPLIGLSTEVAQQVWLHAMSLSGSGQMTARLVKRARKQVLKSEQPSVLAEANATKQRRSSLRQSIRSAFDELLTLLVGTVEREVVIDLVQGLQRLVEPLLQREEKKMVRF